MTNNSKCDSFHKLDNSEYILICCLPKNHKGKHGFTFQWGEQDG